MKNKIKDYIFNQSRYYQLDGVEDIDTERISCYIVDMYQDNLIDTQEELDKILSNQELLEELVDYTIDLYNDLDDENPWPSPQEVYGWGGLGVG